MIITIRVPDNVIKMQYVTSDDGYEEWHTVTYGELVRVEPEDNAEKSGGAKE